MAKKLSPGERIQLLADLREQISEANKVLTELKAQRDEQQFALIDQLDELGINRVSGNGFTATITSTVVPTVTDWDAFYQFIKDEDALYMLERRPLSTAYREKLEERDGADIPGVEPFEKKSISLRSVS